jgi:hypothetical protein
MLIEKSSKGGRFVAQELPARLGDTLANHRLVFVRVLRDFVAIVDVSTRSRGNH